MQAVSTTHSMVPSFRPRAVQMPLLSSAPAISRSASQSKKPGDDSFCFGCRNRYRAPQSGKNGAPEVVGPRPGGHGNQDGVKGSVAGEV
jgi:hypothetical protein